MFSYDADPENRLYGRMVSLEGQTEGDEKYLGEYSCGGLEQLCQARHPAPLLFSIACGGCLEPIGRVFNFPYIFDACDDFLIVFLIFSVNCVW